MVEDMHVGEIEGVEFPALTVIEGSTFASRERIAVMRLEGGVTIHTLVWYYK